MLAVHQIHKLMKALNVDNYQTSQDLIISSCPVHCGDNPNAFNININIDSEWAGKWFCNTHHCHEKYDDDLYGLVEALLNKKNKTPKTFKNVLDYL